MTQRDGGRTPIELAVWLAFIGADRIDLLGGAGPSALTPYLALTPVLVAIWAWRTSVASRWAAPSPRAKRYALVVALLLALTSLSTLLAIDPVVSARRLLLLTLLVTGTLLVAVAVESQPSASRALAGGAKLGLALAVVFDIGQLGALLSPGADIARIGPIGLSFEPFMYAGVIPRLSGQVSDPNRAGLLFLFYTFVIARWGRPGIGRNTWIGLGVLMMLMTLSRSAILAGIVTSGAWLLFERRRMLRPGPMILAASATAALAALLLTQPGLRSGLAEAAAPLAERLSFSEGSAEAHGMLLARGVAEATVSVPTAAIGVGYGNAFLLLQDVFPGNSYGNFHSLFVNAFAESGVFALLVLVLLVGLPALRPGPLRPLVFGLIAFNLAYQAGSEPVFWFLIASAWLSLEPSPQRREAM